MIWFLITKINTGCLYLLKTKGFITECNGEFRNKLISSYGMEGPLIKFNYKEDGVFSYLWTSSPHALYLHLPHLHIATNLSHIISNFEIKGWGLDNILIVLLFFFFFWLICKLNRKRKRIWIIYTSIQSRNTSPVFWPLYSLGVEYS